MRPDHHLVRDIDGLEKAAKRGLRYYYTKCGSVAMFGLLESDPENVECGACRTLANAPKEDGGEAGLVDLSDFDALDSLPDQGAVPYPEPEFVPFEELCTRLGMDPEKDPKGRLGNLDIDIRLVLTEAGRKGAAPILAMVSQLPIAQPLVEEVYRLCHRLTWTELVGGRWSVVGGSAGSAVPDDAVALGESP